MNQTIVDQVIAKIRPALEEALAEVLNQDKQSAPGPVETQSGPAISPLTGQPVSAQPSEEESLENPVPAGVVPAPEPEAEAEDNL